MRKPDIGQDKCDAVGLALMMAYPVATVQAMPDDLKALLDTLRHEDRQRFT